MSNNKIAILGLGYVGLPIKKYKVEDFIKISKGKHVLLDIKGMYNFST